MTDVVSGVSSPLNSEQVECERSEVKKVTLI